MFDWCHGPDVATIRKNRYSFDLRHNDRPFAIQNDSDYIFANVSTWAQYAKLLIKCGTLNRWPKAK